MTYIKKLDLEQKALRNFSGENIPFGTPPHPDSYSKSFYTTNKYGFRGPELVKNQEMVAIGCSYTFGQGVLRENIWASIVADQLGLSWDNLGIAGASIERIVRTFIEYCRIYGNPKVAYALFPTHKRLMQKLESVHIETQVVPKFLKSPYNIQYAFSEEDCVYQCFSWIEMFETFCDSNGIECHWGTWDLSLVNYINECMNEKPNYFKHYRNLAGYNADHIADCLDHEDLKEKYEEIFHWGGDDDRVHLGIMPHWGVHWHQHVAEDFLK